MEEAVSELYKQILQTPETFRRSRDIPESLPVKTQCPNTSDDLYSEVAETDASQYEVSDSELLHSEGMAPEEVKGSIPDQTASIRPVTFRPEEALQSTQFWIGSSRSDAPVPRGSIPEGTSLVAVPGKGSLSVTGPTRSQQGGAKPNSRLSSVTSGQKRPPTSELRQGIQGVIGGKALGTEEPSQAYSGSRVSRRDLIVLGSSISLW